VAAEKKAICPPGKRGHTIKSHRKGKDQVWTIKKGDEGTRGKLELEKAAPPFIGDDDNLGKQEVGLQTRSIIREKVCSNSNGWETRERTGTEVEGSGRRRRAREGRASKQKGAKWEKKGGLQ